jgi:hypothetical protein
MLTFPEVLLAERGAKVMVTMHVPPGATIEQSVDSDRDPSLPVSETEVTVRVPTPVFETVKLFEALVPAATPRKTTNGVETSILGFPLFAPACDTVNV